MSERESARKTVSNSLTQAVYARTRGQRGVPPNLDHSVLPMLCAQVSSGFPFDVMKTQTSGWCSFQKNADGAEQEYQAQAKPDSLRRCLHAAPLK